MHQRVSIAHYEQAAVSGATPSLQQLRRRQQAMAACVDRGEWAASRYCESFTACFVQAVARAHVVVDVGADAGFYSYLAAAHLPPGGRVVALEPEPLRWRLLRELFARRPQVRVLRLAASDTRGRVVLTRPRGCSPTLAAVSGRTFPVRAAALDRLTPRADVVKIDVEGAEARTLAGMAGLLTRHRPIVFLEYHPWIEAVTPGGVAAMHRLLAGAEYACYRTDRGRIEEVSRLGGRLLLVPREQGPPQAALES